MATRTTKKKTKKKTKKRSTRKATAKKSTRKKATRKTAAKKAAAPKAKISSSATPRTKSAIFTEIAENTELSRKQVANVFEVMSQIIAKDMGRSGCGQFTVPGLMKVVRVRKPARKARKGVNPFTGEEMMFKAKPATNVVKVRPLKNLKDFV